MVPLLTALTLWSAPLPFPGPGPARGDLKALQGAWVLAYSVSKGVREGVTQEAVWLIEGVRVTTSLDGKPQEVFSLSLDARTRPRTLRLRNWPGPGPGQTTPGRYRLAGDTLTVRMGDEALDLADPAAT